MNREQAIAFINAINRLQPHVAPLMFEALVNNPICHTVIAVANGMLELVPKAPSSNAGGASAERAGNQAEPPK